MPTDKTQIWIRDMHEWMDRLSLLKEVVLALRIHVIIEDIHSAAKGIIGYATADPALIIICILATAVSLDTAIL